MTPQVNYLPGAICDFDESHDWYAERSLIAARRFVQAVGDGIQRVAENPSPLPFVDEQLLYPPINHRSAERGAS
jgi:plasmid stabilization system protein ParE